MKKEKKKPKKCLNCGKETEGDRLYCDAECYREYHSKKKNEGKK